MINRPLYDYEVEEEEDSQSSFLLDQLPLDHYLKFLETAIPLKNVDAHIDLSRDASKVHEKGVSRGLVAIDNVSNKIKCLKKGPDSVLDYKSTSELDVLELYEDATRNCTNAVTTAIARVSFLHQNMSLGFRNPCNVLEMFSCKTAKVTS